MTEDAMSQSERLTEAYEMMKESQDYDYERVTYEHPKADVDWVDGYTTHVELVGEPALKVVTSEEAVTIPWHRVVSTRTMEP